MSLFCGMILERGNEDSPGKSSSQSHASSIHLEEERPVSGPAGDQADHRTRADAQGGEAEAHAAAGAEHGPHLSFLPGS